MCINCDDSNHKEPSPLSVACPVSVCGALHGEPCRRLGRVSGLFHATRLTVAHRAAGYVRVPAAGEEVAQRFLDAATGRKKRKSRRVRINKAE